MAEDMGGDGDAGRGEGGMGDSPTTCKGNGPTVV